MSEKIRLVENTKIMFTGDSITDCGRRDPAYTPLGRGYVHFAANTLLARYPELNLDIANTGISGDTTRTLKFRWQRDCISYNPTVLSILIGVNDVWCQHDEPNLKARAVMQDEFTFNYTEMLKNARDNLDCQLILCEPFMFCSNPDNPMLNTLRQYIEIVHKLASRFDALIVPFQAEIDEIIGRVGPARWSDDMVHPSQWAHAWLAQKWLEATELK